ncbi:MAG: MBL fold metallo-hydrolase [Candidatus Absconditabacterales bacterium]|nr:MBL fold metallo-hydrolase [Candidatus Absconditabacterales bacterium]
MQNNNSSITIVAENTCLMNNILAQHGVSFWIKYYGKNYLFDCAQIFEGLEYNFKELNLNPEKLDGIIISHDHYDHVHALPKFIEKYKTKKIYVPKDFKSLENKNIIKVDNYWEIEKGFFLTGSMDGGNAKEQSAILDFGKKGIMIIVGCSHPGIINIVENAIKITGNKKIMGIIGGLHLVESSYEEIMNIVEYLKKIDISFIIPGHCTGNDAVNILRKELPEKIKTSLMGSIGAGNSVEFMPEIKFHID